MDKTSDSKSALPVQWLVLMGIGWAVFALLFFLLFSVQFPGQERPGWYQWGTTILETVAFLWAAILCFRNWRSPQIVSGRNVWLLFGLGMFSYFIGSVLFSYWEMGLGIEPDVSPGDFFYVLTYIFLILGMLMAVGSRRLNLEIWQWGIVAAIAALGILVSWVVSNQSPAQSLANPTNPWLIEPVAAQTAPATTKPAPVASPVPVVKKTPALTVSPKALPDKEANVPQWAKSLEEVLSPLKPVLDWFYVISDILLLILATILLLAFWGGRFSQTWRMVAAAAFCLFIADVGFKYASRPGADYQSGGLVEVLWIFSAILFGIGAALEYDLSSRSRSRSSTRRRTT